MSINDPSRYLVRLSEYAKRHYVKAFEKRYAKKQWEVTLSSIVAEMARVEENIRYKKAETIHSGDNQRIIKYYFRVAQTQDSAKRSGNRVIALIDDIDKVVTILLLYSKNEITTPNETAKWQKQVKDNFPGLRHLVK